MPDPEPQGDEEPSEAPTPERFARALAMARRLSQELAAAGHRAALMGALAMSVRGYARATEDIDLAVHLDPYRDLAALERRLRGEGFEAEVAFPDADDPLGGVLTIHRSGPESILPVQLVNFYNPWSRKRNPGSDAIAAARDEPTLGLLVVDLPHLVTLKLYAGGIRSRLDVLELLSRNRDADLGPVRAACAKWSLTPDLEACLRDLDSLRSAD